MDNCKYIVVDFMDEGEIIVMFSPMIVHAMIAESMRRAMPGFIGVVGAGFVRMENGKPVCYGESMSLNIKSRERDTLLAQRLFPSQ